jgi:hypothetical protein
LPDFDGVMFANCFFITERNLNRFWFNCNKKTS